MVFLIQSSCFSERKEYTPGFFMSPQRPPKDVTPTSAPLHSSGPPESPWRECEHEPFTNTERLKTEFDTGVVCSLRAAPSPGRCLSASRCPNRRRSCCWWWQVWSCSTRGSCTWPAQTRSRWRTSGPLTACPCQLPPSRPPDTCCRLLAPGLFDPAWATWPFWFASLLFWAEIVKKMCINRYHKLNTILTRS